MLIQAIHSLRTSWRQTLGISLLGVSFFSSALMSPAQAALREGEDAPDFHTQASLAGQEFSYHLQEALKKGPVVVYFYPAAFTTGCTIQAHAFAQKRDQFKAAGASIIGVSLDNIKNLNQFSADPQACANKIPVAADPTGTIARSYDLKIQPIQTGAKDNRGQDLNHAFAERTTFVVAPNGRIVATIGGIAPDVNVERALQAVKRLTTTH